MIYNHEHSHSPKTYNRAFLIGTSLNIGFVLVEAWFGTIAHSLALLAVGVVFAGIAILLTGWLWFDPVISLIIVVVIVFGTWNLFKDALELLPSRRKNIDNISILLLLDILLFNRRGAESAEGIKKRLIYSLKAGKE